MNVVAKDKHGKPVADLGRDDFVLRDNGQEQEISLFALEETSGAAPAVPSSPARLTFTNRPGPGIAAVTVFLFDELNTKLTDQEFAKKEFLRYLRGYRRTAGPPFSCWATRCLCCTIFRTIWLRF